MRKKLKVLFTVAGKVKLFYQPFHVQIYKNCVENPLFKKKFGNHFANGFQKGWLVFGMTKFVLCRLIKAFTKLTNGIGNGSNFFKELLTNYLSYLNHHVNENAILVLNLLFLLWT